MDIVIADLPVDVYAVLIAGFCIIAARLLPAQRALAVEMVLAGTLDLLDLDRLADAGPAETQAQVAAGAARAGRPKFTVNE